MAKQRLSMADSLTFTSKTRQVLTTLGVSPTVESVEPEDALPAPTMLSLGQIVLPKKQPRRFFAEPAMASLVESIKTYGILQPLLVRPTSGKRYELVAGERRYRAAIELDLPAVPVHIQNLDDQSAAQVALLENLQREDLNPVEETEAILELLSMHLACSHEEVASLLNLAANLQKQGDMITDNVVRRQWEQVVRIFEVIGKLTPESFRSHRLPLLSLPGDVLDALREGKLEYTKARALAAIKDEDDRQDLLNIALEQNLSVREIKRLVSNTKPTEQTTTSELPQRMKAVYNQIKQSKVWENPKKVSRLEKLLNQMEALLEN
jgi:ParB family transcriptional regulator, chromosome partitioning protein